MTVSHKRRSKRPRTNLKRVKPPNDEDSFFIPRIPHSPIGIVTMAMSKFYLPEEIQKVHSFRRSQGGKDDVIADFMRADLPDIEVRKDEHYIHACQYVSDLFRPPELLLPVHYCDLRYYPWTLNTSVERPFSQDPELKQRIKLAYEEGRLPDQKMTFGNCYNEVFEKNRTLVHQIKHGKAKGDMYMYPFTAHARSHLVQENEPDKIRMVFGVPKLLLQVELMFLWTFFNFLRQGTTPIAWGYETFNGGVYRIYNETANLYPQPNLYLTIDWKMFDKTARFSIIDDVHDIWKSYMDWNSGYHPTYEYQKTEAQPEKLASLWKWMSHAVKHSPTILPDGSMWKRTSATIASGLLETQVLDTFVNLIMLFTCLFSFGFDETDLLYALALGDDSLIGITNKLAMDKESLLNKIHEEANLRFGAILNTKKSDLKSSLDGLQFLGYYMRNAMPYRDEYRLLAQLCFPERHWDLNRMMSRCIGIAWADCCRHPRVYKVCLDVYVFCASHGAVPDIAGSDYLRYFKLYSDIDVDKFPSKEEIACWLLEPRLRNEALDERFFPSSHFIVTT